LHCVITKEKYAHFMLFHTAMYIFISSVAYDPEWIDFGEQLLRKFVNEAPELYYSDILVYNMHSLTHLRKDVRNFGPLDNFSAFQFENFMQVIKRRLRTKHSHLKQIVNRFKEEEGFVSYKYPHFAVGVGKISTKPGDNCFLTSTGKICVIQSIDLEKGLCNVKCFKEIKCAQCYPCKSSVLGINMVKKLGYADEIELSSLVRKCILMPYRKRFMCIPLCSSSMKNVN